jgi:hypothetical protein
MKITISKSQWETIGRKSGWTKISSNPPNLENNMQELTDTLKNMSPLTNQTQQMNQGTQKGSTWQSNTAVPDTAKSMVQNLQGTNKHIQYLIDGLNNIAKGIPLADPKSLSVMMDQIISSIQNTKKFVPTIIQYMGFQNQQNQQPK